MMKPKQLSLTEEEKLLTQLFLDVSNFIGQNSEKSKPDIRFTGGWVRDKLLGAPSKDIDVGISSMTGFQFGKYIQEYLDSSEGINKYSQYKLGSLQKIEANPEKSKHLETVTTKVFGLDVDLVNLRKEEYAEDSRNPKMEFGTPEEDALRRDATVNALFYSLSSREVEDFTGKGLEDMEKKIIRTPLSPYQTFKDDPLRVLRCIRFAARLGYSIDPEAEKAMRDESIKEALKLKISRERIGIEIEKMLKGPKPLIALTMIDRLGLYNTIFTNLVYKEAFVADIQRWGAVYNGLAGIIDPPQQDPMSSPNGLLLRSELVRNPEETYLAWVLAALVPWMFVEKPAQAKIGKKAPPPVAATVVREGLKLDNKLMKIAADSVLFKGEIVAMVEDISIEDPAQAKLPSKRKQSVPRRDTMGLAVRKWGPHWRSNFMFAFLCRLAEVNDEPDREALLHLYAAWLTQARDLDILDAYAIQPLLDGRQLQEIFDAKPGKWIVGATQVVLEWQLLHPESKDVKLVTSEVLRRRSEFMLP